MDSGGRQTSCSLTAILHGSVTRVKPIHAPVRSCGTVIVDGHTRRLSLLDLVGLIVEYLEDDACGSAQDVLGSTSGNSGTRY